MESMDIGLKCFVEQIYKARSEGRVELLSSLLEGVVEANILSARYLDE